MNVKQTTPEPEGQNDLPQPSQHIDTSKKEAGLELEGIVTEAVKGAFRVHVVQPGEQINPAKPGHQVMAYLGGKLRKNSIRIVVGDRVKVEVSLYDLQRGRIIYRMK